MTNQRARLKLGLAVGGFLFSAVAFGLEPETAEVSRIRFHTKLGFEANQTNVQIPKEASTTDSFHLSFGPTLELLGDYEIFENVRLSAGIGGLVRRYEFRSPVTIGFRGSLGAEYDWELFALGLRAFYQYEEILHSGWGADLTTLYTGLGPSWQLGISAAYGSHFVDIDDVEVNSWGIALVWRQQLGLSKS